MLNKFKDLIQRPEWRSILEEGIRAFRLEPGDTFERAVSYVETGAGSELLMELAGRDTSRTAEYLDTHADLRAWHFTPYDAKAVLRSIGMGWTVEKGSKARGALYAGGELTPEQLARLGRLFAAVSTDLVRSSDRVPVWFAALLNDVCTTRDLGDGYQPVGPEQRPRWSPGFLGEVARAGGVADGEVPGLVVRVLFDRAQPPSYYGDPFVVLVEHPGVGAYLAAHADVVREVVPGMKAAGKVVFLDYLAAWGAECELFAGVVGRLVADSAKSVREKALTLLGTLPAARQVVVLEPLLGSVAPGRLAAVLAHLVGVAGGEVVLRRAMEAQKPGARRKAFEGALVRSDVLAAPEGEPPTLMVPGFEPVAEVVLGEEFVQAAQAAVAAELARTQAELHEVEGKLHDEEGKGSTNQWRWKRDRLRATTKDLSAVTPASIERVRSYLSGTGEYPGAKVLRAFRRPAVKSKLPALTLLQEARLVATHTKGPDQHSWSDLMQVVDLDVDLRVLADALRRAGTLEVDRMIRGFVFGWNTCRVLSPGNAWAYFSENPQGLEVVLGLRPAPEGESGYGQAERVEVALRILGAFPVIPQQFLACLTGLALGEGRTHRVTAQGVLEAHPGARALAEQGLGDGKAEVRVAAAGWLARLGDADAVPALIGALGRERREVVRAALLTALEALGADIGSFVSPEVLGAEAVKGLKGKVPASLGWFPFDALPRVRWAADGTVVDPEIIRWWVILAVKLKDPSGLGLIGRYVSLLTDHDQAKLGRFVVDAWIAQDTRHPSVEDSRAHADAEAQSRYDRAQDYYKRYPQYHEAWAAKTVDQHWADAYREHQSIYLGSAIADKGLLALTVGTPGTDLARAVQGYFQNNPGRRAQAEALVTALAANGQPAAIGVLLSVARRFKQVTVQARAQELAQDLADRRGWTPDQLADRTVPTAGFDDDGILRLDLGSRAYTGRITSKFTLELSNDTGKTVKTLPPARHGDDPDLVKTAKTQLATTRKELKHVVTLQTQRLHEAMCTGRTWPAADWTQYIHAHPIMSRLAARLVWVHNPGQDQQAFRPGDGGTLIDVNDNDITLPEGATIALAHTTTLGTTGAHAWRGHLADYQITPLFDQFRPPAPPITGGQTEITDRQGWVTDSFTIRAQATKLGYTRAPAQDGGWFTDYRKPYPTLALTAVIGFTGAFLPEENIPAAITTLTFEHDGRSTTTAALADVPPILLAETYHDYTTIATAGTHDPNWKKTTQW